MKISGNWKWHALQHYAWSHLLLLVLFWLLRVTHMIFANSNSDHLEGGIINLFYGFLFDAWFVATIWIVTLPVYLLGYKIFGPFSKYFLTIVFLCFLFIEFSLQQYYFTSHVLLGADFWTYSFSDIQTTILSSADIRPDVFFPVILPALLLLYFFRIVHEWYMSKKALMVIYVSGATLSVAYFMAGPQLSWFNKESDFNGCVNKSAYFYQKSIEGYLEGRLDRIQNRHETNSYPLLHPADTSDVLSPYFSPTDKKPNLVFILVEGLSGTFMDPESPDGGCTPFLDSLAKHSLFWKNTLSNSGRTFGVLPSILGSLPFGEKGFLESKEELPAHYTILSLLKKEGYRSLFFYGGNINFDRVDIFLERQGIDLMLGESRFSDKYKAAVYNKGEPSWGFHDMDLFQFSLEQNTPDTSMPYVSIYQTLSSHEPFLVPDQANYLNQVKQIASRSSSKNTLNQFPMEYSCLRYTDNALQEFIKAYSKRPDFSNTIFIITGDHRMIPISQPSRISRFHVPLIIYSPLLQRSKTFESVNTHMDVTPTLLPFLSHYCGLIFPDSVPWLGSPLDTSAGFRSLKSSAFMRTKGEIVDYLDHSHFLSDGNLYQILPGMNLRKISDREKENELKDGLDRFKVMNKYVVDNNRILNDQNDTIHYQPEFSFTRKEKYILHFMGCDSLTPDALLKEANRRAAVGQYENARLICKWTLVKSPNYSDVRLLLGSTYMWEKRWGEARAHFTETIERNPEYVDAWRRSIQLEMVSGNFNEAAIISRKAYFHFRKNEYREAEQKAVKLRRQFKIEVAQ